MSPDMCEGRQHSCPYSCSYSAPTTGVAGTGSPLENLNINPDTIAISGFSSGGAFSTQFHVAFSEKISGVGTFAGLSYLAKSGLETTSKYAEVDNLALAGLIDPVDNLKNDNVYIFQGKIDSVVPAIEAGILEDFYNNYLAEGNNIEFKEIEDSEHNFPTAETGGPCDILNGPDFVSNCAYDGAFRVLSKTLGSIEPKDEDAVDFELKDFDQAEFLGKTQLDSLGTVWIRTATCSSLITASMAPSSVTSTSTCTAVPRPGSG